MTRCYILSVEGAGETLQEEEVSLSTPTLFHLLLLVSTKSCCQQCWRGEGGGQLVTLIPIKFQWHPQDGSPVSHRHPAGSSQPQPTCTQKGFLLLTGLCLSCCFLLALQLQTPTHTHPRPENIPAQWLQGWSSTQSESPPWEGGPPSHYVPSFRLSLGPMVFFGVLFTPLSIISDIGNNPFTSGDQAGVTFRPRDSGDCLDMFSVVTTGEGGSSVPGSQCAEARDAAKHPQGKNIPLNSELSSPKCQQLLKLSNPASWSAFLVEMTVWVFFSSWTVTDAEVEKEMQADKLNQTLGSFLTRLLS